MVKRVSYFDRQFLRAEDFHIEQAYHLGRRRGISAGMFRPGVATGLEVVRLDAGSLRVTAGLAIDRLGREIVLEADWGPIAVDPAAAVEIWIAYAEAGSDPVSYLGAGEQRFTRIDEAPAITAVPPGNVPANGIRLAVLPPGGEPGVGTRQVAGPRAGSVAEPSLADDAVTSRVLAEADGGASGQDAASGSGVKTGHIQDGAVTSDKLANEVVEGLAERTIEKVLATGVPIADGAISPAMLADRAVSSRALAEAAPGSTDQDTGSGTGVKTAHLTDRAVTGSKLGDGAVMFEKLAAERVLDTVVTVPRATGGPPLTPGRRSVDLEKWPSDLPAFYFIHCRPIFTLQVPAIRWKQMARFEGTIPPALVNCIEIENLSGTDTDVRCIAYRLRSLSD